MSFSWEDAAYEQWMEELYEEHSRQAIEEFTGERLRSFYLKNPHAASAASGALAEARALADSHPEAGLVLAISATEVAVKNVLLRPIVYGLIHSEAAAGFITELSLGHQTLTRFRELLFGVLNEYGGVDLATYGRDASGKRLWEEILTLQDRRNAVVHRAEKASHEEAYQAVQVAAVLLETLFPAVVRSLGLHLHGGILICDDWHQP